MNFDREEFNDYGVRTNYYSSNRSKTQSNLNPKLTLIVGVTVLFSIFNFVVGYMIGKFLGNDNSKSAVFLENHKLVKSRDHNEITGIPSLSLSNTATSVTNNNLKEEEIVLDLEEPLVEVTPPQVVQRTPSPKAKLEIKQSTDQKAQPSKEVTTTQKKSEQEVAQPRPKPQVNNIKYFIQVSSNEKREIAEDTVKKLKLVGLTSFIQETNINGKKIYRVRIGAFNSYEEAYKTLEKAKKVNGEAFLVVSK
ncbi:MAG: SPOR domain-containing protein [Brevinematia bacterium]